ncbi:Serine/threonine-protein phosphatase Pgam5 mitochondrial [Fasciola gigantica]|uniref:Serine/threonine-protein phosphatase PGAM5, mitochondrial n=1 Tax=Fasciola gigantica TaxID=46835 RepID=A0A504Z9T7_FASGI|nr:Serine/threonine-protein phosphatase Pgam5 mitochondrial [Fasciola gigantica]
MIRRKVIIFVRHGQYKTKVTSKDEKVLTELGWRQAYATGLYLRRWGIKIDRIIHSNLIRARQTTAALLIGLSNDPDDILFDVPTLVNLSAPYRAELQGNYSIGVDQPATSYPSVSSPESTKEKINMCGMADPYKPYPDSPFDCQESRYLAEGPPPVAPQPPGASSTSDEVRLVEGRRLEDGFRLHINRMRSGDAARPCPPNDFQDETIVFVGHANVFRYWLCRALQLPPEAWLRIQLYHGSVSCLVLHFESDPNGACLVTATKIGEVGHMPKELLSR